MGVFLSILGTLSVALSVMDSPTIHSGVPAFADGRFSGEGIDRNWLPSSDRYALRTKHGKLRPTELVYVGADKRLCFGLIGNKCFCCSRECKVKSHTKTRFSMMGARGGWFLPAKSTLIGEPTAFVQPFLDVNKITQETEYHLKEMEKRTTADWENFMAVCCEEWDNLVTRGLDNIQEGVGFGKVLGMDDDEEDGDSKYNLCEGNLNLKKPPAIFVWDKDLAERVLKTELEEGTPKDTHEAVEELQAALGDLEGMVVDSQCNLSKDAFDVLTHIGYSVTEIVAAIDCINKCGRCWMSDIGSINELREESG